MKDNRGSKVGKKEYVAPKIKTLAEADLEAHTIFDVIMPLPGLDVAYPGGELGERYREFLVLDGLEPDNLKHSVKYEGFLKKLWYRLADLPRFQGLYSARFLPKDHASPYAA